MSEVKKYKERLGDEEEKNRPLVKWLRNYSYFNQVFASMFGLFSPI